MGGRTGYPSIDKPWLKYYSDEAINAPLPECTVYRNIYEHNREHLEDIALEYYGHKTSYGKLFDEVESCAKALKAAGVKLGDRVTLCTAGVPEAVYLVLACSKIGAIANFLNPLFTTEQMTDRINDTEAELLFVLDRMYPYIAGAIDKTCIKRVIIIPATGSLPAVVRALAALKEKPDAKLREALRQEKFCYWRGFISVGNRRGGACSSCGPRQTPNVSGGASPSPTATEAPYEKDRPVVMVYSSGTTGASKGIVLTNDGINATIAHYQNPDFSYERGNTFLQVIPVWFSTGIVLSVLMPLCLGTTLIPEPVYSKEVFAEDIANHRPNMTLTITSFWVHAINSGKLKALDLSNLSYPATGGEAVLPEVEQRINSYLTERHCPTTIIKGWGMCELGSTIASTSVKHGKPGSAGYPILGACISAFETETDAELPYGKRGELRALSPAHMKGYYNNSRATDEFFKADASGNLWGCTGDIGYVDEDGFVFVLGRASDCFITPDGGKVYLFDIENVLLQDEAVSMCKVVDVEAGSVTVPVAHIVLSESGRENTEATLRRLDALCREQLAEYAVPVAYKFRTDFPVKPSGKRDAEALRNERDGFLNTHGEAVAL